MKTENALIVETVKIKLPRWGDKTWYNASKIEYTNHRGILKFYYKVIERVSIKSCGEIIKCDGMKDFIYYPTDVIEIK